MFSLKVAKPFLSLKSWGQWLVRKRSRIFSVFIGTTIVMLAIAIAVFSQQKVEISVLIQAIEVQQMIESGIVADFEAQNPDIHLNLIESPNASNYVEDLYTSSFLLGDSPYDLVFMDIVWTPKFAAAGWLEDLSPRVSEAELANFLTGDVNGGSYQGKLYRMPFRSDAGMLYYRQDLLEQAGFEPPETYAELIKISKQIQATTDVPWGYLWQGKQYEGLPAMFVEVLEGSGGFWVDPATKEVGLDSPEAIAALEFLTSTINEEVSPPGVTTYQEEEVRRPFQAGEAVFMRNWPYAWSLANGDDSPVQGKIAIKPMVHAPGQNSGACQGGWGFGIAKTTKHPEEAWRVIEYFASAEAQKKFVLKWGYVPSRAALFNDPDIVSKYSHYPELLGIVQKAVLRPPIAQYAQASDILQRYLSSAITGRLSPEQALQTAARETRSLLET
ncbi:carbohydrate ABC transporter substrate-binding protein, CUT1 family [Thalassoporum mexicanum PCC 7367]|uniref:ABC transporter substrate-binding protein n=1 Tax=Thalassoporum mexicanum TaxID=3457544 RepID=UPI00029F8987|nr:ABC transporter substrate-binding protein [Pseudanabaena sp. PCC 7367]AFY70460.1 carbohydrate ABC transporter substrate-binding protein, CUT1 family [Pseudanabaena sp. PCC 7367]